MPHQKIAVITGGSKGLGNALAQWLATQSIHLILTARNAAILDDTATIIRERGGSVETIAGDVADPAHRQAVADAVATHGRLDLLFNNASTLGALPMPSLTDYDLSALLSIFKTNVIAPVGFVQVLLPYLQAAQGLVVNISSDAAIGGYAGWGGYGASKAALDLISATFANELTDTDISVVAVDPGDMRTEMHQAAFPDEDISDRPLPESTLPFWAWLIGQDYQAINGQRFAAQAEVWEVSS